MPYQQSRLSSRCAIHLGVQNKAELSCLHIDCQLQSDVPAACIGRLPAAQQVTCSQPQAGSGSQKPWGRTHATAQPLLTATRHRITCSPCQGQEMPVKGRNTAQPLASGRASALQSHSTHIKDAANTAVAWSHLSSLQLAMCLPRLVACFGAIQSTTALAFVAMRSSFSFAIASLHGKTCFLGLHGLLMQFSCCQVLAGSHRRLMLSHAISRPSMAPAKPLEEATEHLTAPYNLCQGQAA